MKTATFVLAAGILLVSVIEDLALRQLQSEAVVRAQDRQDPRDILHTRPFTGEGSGGGSGDALSNGAPLPKSITDTCTGCHDSAGVVARSVEAPHDLGLTKPARGRLDQLLLYTSVSGTTASGSSP
jgi:hypothetical protein